jgi:PiT family inorganic phosphate transporter
MIRFRLAALIASVGVMLGAFFGGAGVTSTIGALGAVSAIAGSFTVALSAGLAVAWMSRSGLPMSTSQAVVGAIIGWNLFTGSPTDRTVLMQIVSAWVLSPVIAAAFAMLLYLLARWWMRRSRMHILTLDAYTRAALILVGAIGAYALGANSIANVMGVFVPASPFRDHGFGPLVRITGTQQLFLLGSIAIAVGIHTRSARTMTTIGGQIFKLTPMMALLVVLAHTLALLLFTSESLQSALHRIGMPAPPLVPVSSTQAIIGAIMGVAILKGGRGIHLGTLGRVLLGWVMTPVIAGVLSYVLLVFVQNVFEQQVVAGR